MINKRIAAVAFFAVFGLCKQLQVSGWVPIKHSGKEFLLKLKIVLSPVSWVQRRTA